MVCSNCGESNAPERKFCGECGSALAQVCAACGAPNAVGVKFCGECGVSMGATVEGAHFAHPRRDVRDSASTVVAEIRLVSVLFADLVGFTALSESRDPEEVRDLLSRYFEVCRGLIERYGGTVEKFIGDAVVGVFGAPNPRHPLWQKTPTPSGPRDAACRAPPPLPRPWRAALA